MSLTTSPHIARADDHQRLQFLGPHPVRVLLDAAGSGGRVSLMRAAQVAGDAAPLHVHGEEDETLVVLDGAATVWIGDDQYEVESGDVAFMPRDVPHAYAVTSEQADLLFVITPGGLESFFRRVGHDLATPLPARWTPSTDEMAQVFAEHGGTILGPPPALDS